jgi:hypothetical protein
MYQDIDTKAKTKIQRQIYKERDKKRLQRQKLHPRKIVGPLKAMFMYLLKTTTSEQFNFCDHD